ncbi:hypothetical protein ACJJIL_15555 [Microbulbifer sp. EKSA005]|uniref:hypothetical protein n=1 Tax=Microbulbifer sp. EKSA005 TaxID=3243364 RepID=UPI004041284F
MTSKFEWINSRSSLVLCLLGIVVAGLTIKPHITIFSSPLTTEEVKQLIADHESFVIGQNINGQLSVFHDNFSITITNKDGVKETLNKSQYEKKITDLSKLGIRHSIKDLHQDITHISNDTAIVSMIAKETVIIKNFIPKINETKLYQTIIVKKDGGVVKILKVSSITEKA